MHLEVHDDECAKNTGDVHTLYIRQGDSPWTQKFTRIGVICSACYKMDFDQGWMQSNEERYETVKRKIPVTRRRLTSAEKRGRLAQIYDRIEKSTSESEPKSDLGQNDDNNDTE